MTGGKKAQASRFPDPRLARDDGILCVGGNLRVETLVDAYSHGIFPWPVSEDAPIFWFSPPRRAVIDFDSFHVTRRLAQFMRNMEWTITLDRDFPAVIRGCSTQPRGGTWITPAMIDGYIELHRAGHAHSLECREGEKIVGGIYGVFIGGVFSAESMFFAASNASKVCLVRLVEHLAALGLTWLDVQALTPTTSAFGAREIPRAAFIARIRHAHARPDIRPFLGGDGLRDASRAGQGLFSSMR